MLPAPKFVANLLLTEFADVYGLEEGEYAPGLVFSMPGMDVAVRLVNIEDEGVVGYYCILNGGDCLTGLFDELSDFILAGV